MFLQEKAAALTLHIPAAWESTNDGCRFADNGKPSQSNPGRVANKLHKSFSERIEENTLQQIDSCRYLGAKLQIHDGFKKRNDYVALSEHLIAFSWSEGEEPTKGGTLDTWSKCSRRKLHIPLSSLEKQTSSESTYVSFTTHSGNPRPHAVEPKPWPHKNYEKVVPCCSTSVAVPSCGYSRTSSESTQSSVDSGIGGSQSSTCSQSSEMGQLQGERSRKRQRSESGEVSDIDCDGLEKLASQLSTKKLKGV